MADAEKKIDKKVKDVSESTNQDKPKSQEEILIDQLCEGLETYKQRNTKVFLSAVTAGLEIGFSFLLLGILYTILKDRVSKDIIFYYLAFAYPVGFIIVVLGRSILFTEQTSLLSLPVFHRKRDVTELLRLWGIVILGNLIGGYIFTVLAGNVSLELGVITKQSIKAIAHHVTKADRLIIFGSAIFAGWLMAVLSWLLSSSKETISRILVVYIITFTVGFVGFHHSIVGSIEVFAGLIYTDKISFLDYLNFQWITLLGNAIGGVIFVAFLRYRAFASNY
jgi:formate/nitrite transporter FocA (FNT family)